MQECRCKQCGLQIGFGDICWKCEAENDRKSYLALSDEAVQAKVNEIIQNIESNQYACDLFLVLFCYRKINTRAIADAAFEKKIYYPPHLYYDASPELRDKIIKVLMETTDSQLANNLLNCLAMQGDEEVLKFFIELEKHPRIWRKKLYVDPFVYARTGGWSFDKSGNRLSLTFPKCYAIANGDQATDTAVRIGTLRKDQCPHCTCQLTDIMTIDGSDERLAFLDIKGVIKAVTCPNCVSYEPIYCKYKVDGDSKMLPFDGYTEENFFSAEDFHELEHNSFVLSKEPVNPFYAGNSEDLNSIGGMPNWIQDTEYHSCPSCDKTMKFLAQLNRMEGSLFVQICTDCQIISTVRQQT